MSSYRSPCYISSRCQCCCHHKTAMCTYLPSTEETRAKKTLLFLLPLKSYTLAQGFQTDPTLQAGWRVLGCPEGQTRPTSWAATDPAHLLHTPCTGPRTRCACSTRAALGHMLHCQTSPSHCFWHGLIQAIHETSTQGWAGGTLHASHMPDWSLVLHALHWVQHMGSSPVTHRPDRVALLAESTPQAICLTPRH